MVRLPFPAQPVFNPTRQALLPALALALGCCLLPATQADELYELAREERLTLRALVAYGKLPTDTLASLSELRSQGIDILAAGPDQLNQYLNDAGLKLSQPQRQAMAEALSLMQEASIARPKGLETFVEVSRPPLASLPSLPPLRLPAPLPLVEIGSTQYAGIISMAKAASLALMGELEPDELALVEAEWADYYSFPSDEILDYFRRAVPLLQELVNVKEAIAFTASAFDDQWQEAEQAAIFDNEAMAAEALNMAAMLQKNLDSLGQKADALAKAIADLGEQPPARQAMDEQVQTHKRHYQALLDLFASDDVEGIWYGSEIPAEGVAFLQTMDEWPLLFVTYQTGTADTPVYRTLALEPDNSGEGYADHLHMLSDAELAPGHDLELVEHMESGQLNHRYAGSALDEDGDPDSWDFTLQAMLLSAEGQVEYSSKTTVAHAKEALQHFVETLAEEEKAEQEEAARQQQAREEHLQARKERLLTQENVGGFNVTVVKPEHADEYAKILAEQMFGGMADDTQTLGRSAGQSAVLKIAESRVKELGMFHDMTPLFVAAARQWLKERPFSAASSADQDIAAFARLMSQLSGLRGQQTAGKQKARNTAAPAAAAQTPPDQPAADDSANAEEQQARLEQIEFHQHNIRFLEGSLQRARAEMASETDPERKAALEYQLIGLQTDLQSEQDRIASIKTGQLVHTRSAFDDYAHALFIESIEANQLRMQEEQEQIQQFRQGTESLQRLAAMLPPDQAANARAFIERQLTQDVIERADRDVINKIASALHQKVQGYHLGEQARAEEREAWLTLGLEAAENIQTTAELSLLAVSVGSTLGAAGAISQSVRFIQAIDVAYQGVTGYIEGGVKEGALRSAQQLGLLATLGSDAIRGYDSGGLQGAVSQAATSLVFAKAMEFGGGRILGNKAKAAKRSKTAGPANTATPASATGAARPAATSSTTTQAQMKAEYLKARKEGMNLVDDMKKSYAELLQTTKSGLPPEQMKQKVSQLQEKLKQQSIAINANPNAKNYLKYSNDIILQEKIAPIYNAKINGVHKDVQNVFHQKMAHKGWSQQDLREFRNVSSGKSVGMDYDIGLDQRGNINLTKDGKASSVRQWQDDAQSAWEEAYETITGKNASRSWENVTSSAHVESYRDLKILDKNVNLSNLDKKWAEQTASVTSYKAHHMMNEAKGMGHYERLQEICRGNAKDYQSKVVPMLEQLGTPKAKDTLAHWDKINKVMKEFGEGAMDPVIADREIRKFTGGRGIIELTEQMTALMEAAIKFR